MEGRGKVSSLAVSNGLGGPGVVPGENFCFLKWIHSLLSTCERCTVTIVPTYITPPLLLSQIVPLFLIGIKRTGAQERLQELLGSKEFPATQLAFTPVQC